MSITTQELLERYPASVQRMEDWSGGQFYIFDSEYQVEQGFFNQLLEDALDALSNHPEKLTEYGRSVASEIVERIKNRPAPKSIAPRRVSTVLKPGYVYLIQSPTHAYKIGRTVNPDNRLRTFSVKLPFEVEYVCVIATQDMYGLEADLHERFAGKRLNGEWFALSPEDIDYIKGLAT